MSKYTWNNDFWSVLHMRHTSAWWQTLDQWVALPKYWKDTSSVSVVQLDICMKHIFGYQYRFLLLKPCLFCLYLNYSTYIFCSITAMSWVVLILLEGDSVFWFYLGLILQYGHLHLRFKPIRWVSKRALSCVDVLSWYLNKMIIWLVVR